MIDGTYKIGVDTPLSRKEGTVTLRTEGDKLFASIDAPIIGKREMEGRAEGDTFTAEGSGKIKLIGKVDFTVKGEVTGDDLRIDIQSTKGDLHLTGVLI